MHEHKCNLQIRCKVSYFLLRNHFYFRLGIIDSVRKAKIVKTNISSGRKVFKFLKFIDEYTILKLLIKKEYKAQEKKMETLKTGKR